MTTEQRIITDRQVDSGQVDSGQVGIGQVDRLKLDRNHAVYALDLMLRQNKSLTSAQVHQIINTKRYSIVDLEVTCTILNRINKKYKQVDLYGNDVDESLLKNNDDSNENNKNNKNVQDKNIIINNEDYFFYKDKLIIIDTSNNHLVMKHHEHIFDQMIEELTKLCEWLDRRGAYLRVPDEEGNYFNIKTDQIKTCIELFKVLNKIKKD